MASGSFSSKYPPITHSPRPAILITGQLTQARTGNGLTVR